MARRYRIAITVLMAGIVLAAFRIGLKREKYAQARSDIANLAMELERYRMDTGYYPDSKTGLAAVFAIPQSDPEPRFERGYRGYLPRDPWGHPYFYESNGEKFVLGSFGPSGDNPDPDLQLSNDQ